MHVYIVERTKNPCLASFSLNCELSVFSSRMNLCDLAKFHVSWIYFVL